MILFILGLLAGTISGMGIGGGTLLIPALVIFIGLEQHVVQGVNLLFFIPTAVIALIVHIRNKRINFRAAIPVVLAGLVGAYLGSKLAVTTDGNALKKLFGAFLFIMGVFELLRRDGKKQRA